MGLFDKLDTPEGLEAALKEISRLLPAGDDVIRDEDWLTNELTEAQALFSSDQSYAQDGMRRALRAVIEYVDETALPVTRSPVLVLPLLRLLHALEMLDLGIVEPLLQPTMQRPGARPLSLDELEFRFMVAHVIYLTGGPDIAGEAVAQSLAERGFKQQRLQDSGFYTEITTKTVNNWFRDREKNWKKIEAASELGEGSTERSISDPPAQWFPCSMDQGN
jgi:hypothetical protein